MIKLDKFYPRDYQIPFFDAMENSDGKYRNALVIMPRRAGKDVMGWNFAIRWACRKTTSVLYLLPTYAQAKTVIWDAISNDSTRFLDWIPDEIVQSKNASEMKITLRNGSIIQLRGADNYDRSIVGSNPSLIIFSEFSLCDPRAYEFASPILAGNGGSAVFLSTPRGRNHLYSLWKSSERWSDWFRLKLTVDDTKHVTPEVIEKEREKHSEEFIQQEWYTSFDRGIEGSFYSQYINQMHNEGRIGIVPYDPSLPVNTAWDLGYNNTCILYFQITKTNTINIIDCDEPVNRSLADWIRHVKAKPYIFGKHWAPHDIRQHEYNDGMERFEFARNLGLHFEMRTDNGKIYSGIPSVSVDAGIEIAMASFNKISIDKNKCAYLIKALETYHRKWDAEKQKYSKNPADLWCNHAADAFRYLCLVKDKHNTGMTEQDAKNLYNNAVGYNQEGLPFPFNNNHNQFGRMF